MDENIECIIEHQRWVKWCKKGGKARLDEAIRMPKMRLKSNQNGGNNRWMQILECNTIHK